MKQHGLLIIVAILLVLNVVLLVVELGKWREHRDQLQVMQDEAEAATEKLEALQKEAIATQERAERQGARLDKLIGTVEGSKEGEQVVRVVFRARRMELGKLASEICEDQGESCVGVSATKAYTEKGEFWGYSSFSCESRIVDKKGCMKGHDYAIDRMRFRRASSSKVQQSTASSTMCLSDPFYDHAICLGRVVDDSPEGRIIEPGAGEDATSSVTVSSPNGAEGVQ